MDTTVQNNTKQSRYELMVDDIVAAIVEYNDVGEAVELTHTEVDSSYKGQGLARELAHAVLDNLSNEGRAVIPSCPYIRGYLERHPRYVDLVPSNRRSDFGL